MQSSILTDLDALNNMAVFLFNKDPIFSSALAIEVKNKKNKIKKFFLFNNFKIFIRNSFIYIFFRSWKINLVQ